MELSAHELLSAWESFYVIVGSSAGALTGLQFVVIAVIADVPGIGAEDSVAAFGTPTVFHFCLCLMVSALLSAPWPSVPPLAWLLGASGVAGLVYTLIVARRARHQTVYQPVGEDWVWHVMLPLMAYAALIAASAALPHAGLASLFAVGGVVLLLIFVGIHNAWDAVAYVAMSRRPRA